MEIIEQSVHVRFYFVRLRADVEFGGAVGARPCPDIAEHFLVEFLRPGDIKPSRAFGWFGGEVFENRHTDVLRLGSVELGCILDRPIAQSRDIIERGLPRDQWIEWHYGDQSFRFDPARSSCMVRSIMPLICSSSKP